MTRSPEGYRNSNFQKEKREVLILPKKVISIDPDKLMSRILANHLPEFGFELVVANSEKDARKAIEKQKFDLLLMEPNSMSGYVSTFRDVSKAPIIVLSERKAEYDLLRAFEEGAEDYIFKPFHPDELIARMRRIFIRLEYSENHDYYPHPEYFPSIKLPGGIDIDSEKKAILKEKQVIKLTRKERDLLFLLIDNMDEKVNVDQISPHIVKENARMRVFSLRKKMGWDSKKGPLKTIFGNGYELTFKKEENS